MSSDQPPAPPQTQSPFDRALAAPVSTFIFALCVAVFFLAERSGSTRETATLIRFGANYRAGVWHGEWWRLFTSMFLHIGLTHLVWNIFAGFSWTAPFERVLGSGRFLFIYVLSGLAGSALSIIGHDAVSAGASGALFGVMGGIFVLMRERLGSWRALWKEPSQQRTLVMTALWLAIGPFVGFDSFAHLGGMLAGMALTSGLLPGRLNRLGFALFFVVALVVLSLRPIPRLHDGWVDSVGLERAWSNHEWGRVVELTESPAAKQAFALYRGAALVELGRNEEGAALLPTTLEGDEVVWLASLHERSGHPERARAALDAALKVDPSSRDVRWAKYELLWREDDDEAQQIGDGLIGENPGTAMALGIMARKLEREGLLEEALESYDRAVERDAARWAEERALLLIDLGRRDEARRALELAPSAKRLACYLSSVEGDFAGNEKVCGALDDSASSRELKAYRLVGLGKCDDAKALLGNSSRRFGRTLLDVCAVRADGSTAIDAGALTLESRLLQFSVTKNPGDLAGEEDAARNSWVWSLLPEDAKQALPR